MIELDFTKAKHYPVDCEIDACGLRCPMPLLKAKQALNKLTAGQCIRVLATDSGSFKDFHALARLTGYALVAALEEGGVYCYILQK